MKKEKEAQEKRIDIKKIPDLQMKCTDQLNTNNIGQIDLSKVKKEPDLSKVKKELEESNVVYLD